MRRSELSPFRELVVQACAEPRTRQHLFELCGGRKGIGRQRFTGMLAAMLDAGVIERAGEIPNPLHGHGRNNNPMVLVFRTKAVNHLDLDAVKAAGLNSAENSARLLAEHCAREPHLTDSP